MKKFLLVIFLLGILADSSYAVDVGSTNLGNESTGFFTINVNPASRKKLADGVYKYTGKVTFGYPDYNVKVLVNCKSGLYKIFIVKSTQVVDDYGNVKKSGYKEIDRGWEPRRLSGGERELCE